MASTIVAAAPSSLLWSSSVPLPWSSPAPSAERRSVVEDAAPDAAGFEVGGEVEGRVLGQPLG